MTAYGLNKLNGLIYFISVFVSITVSYLATYFLGIIGSVVAVLIIELFVLSAMAYVVEKNIKYKIFSK